MVEKLLLLVYGLFRNSKNLTFVRVRRHKTLNDAIYTLQIPSRHPLAIIQTPSVHHPDTLPTPSKDTSDNIQTPFRHPPNFKHVGSFLVVEARCGLFFFLLLVLLVPWENKVNSYSNQLKLSLVCKLEWSLTKICPA